MASDATLAKGGSARRMREAAQRASARRAGRSIVGRAAIGYLSVTPGVEAPVAQLDRALPSEGRGRMFESSRVRQSFQWLSARLRLKRFYRWHTANNARVTHTVRGSSDGKRLYWTQADTAIRGGVRPTDPSPRHLADTGSPWRWR